MRDSRAFVIAEDKVEKFLNKKTHSVKDVLERFNKHHKKDTKKEITK
jgi:hypothetical protein